MKLGSNKVQETPEEGVGRQREAAVDMGRKKDALTLLRSRLGLVLRKPPRTMGDQSPLDQILQVLLLDRRPNPVALDPAGRQAGSRRRPSPARLLPLRLRCRLLRVLQSHRLFFPHRRGRSSSGAAALEEEQAQWGKLRREKKNEDALFKNPDPAPHMGLLPSD